jgi:hypothetical protein
MSDEEYDDEDVKCPCGCDDDDYEETYDDYDEDDEDYEEDYDDDEESGELDEDDFIQGATSSCPWEFSVPENLNEVLAKDKGKSYSDDTLSYKKRTWAKLWTKVEPHRIDPAQSAADYYLLFGLVHNSFVEFEPLVLPTKEKFEEAGNILGKSAAEITKRHQEIFEVAEKDPRTSLTKLSKKANGMYHDLVEDLDGAFREYVHLACGGELRHHSAMGASLGKSFRRGAWVRWYYIYKDNGPESLLTMADLFEEFGGGSYGGPPWAAAARILYQREVGELGPDEFTNKQLFVDRVFTLEHNGGCFLNKLNWINLRKEREDPYRYHFGEMKEYVLNAHASNPVNIDMLMGHASEPIQKLVKEYLELATSNNIDVVGLWNGKTTQKKAEPVTVAASPKITKDSGIIDWSDEEVVTTTDQHVNPLISELEQSLKKMKGNVNKIVDWSDAIQKDAKNAIDLAELLKD